MELVLENKYLYLSKSKISRFPVKISLFSSSSTSFSTSPKKIKPFEDIYLLAVNRYGLIPNETVFIDDNLDNINTAIRLDFKTIHLVDPYQIKSEIYKYLN